MENIITIEEIKDYLGISTGDKDNLLLLLLASAVESVENYLGIKIRETDIEDEIHEINSAKSKYLFLNFYPVKEIKEVRLNKEAVAVSEIVLNGKEGYIKLSSSWSGQLSVSYKSGLAAGGGDLPAVFKLALLELIKQSFLNENAKIKSETLGDYSVAYNAPSVAADSVKESLKSYMRYRI
ncbi:Phage gp6-like head-tail connector protein [Parelusimicrobium proximum]|uniref:head-tail connector protein n=1 Tax=Parelusimicrobium proximum TaxID=3228953 RepID=UPI003D16660A